MKRLSTLAITLFVTTVAALGLAEPPPPHAPNPLHPTFVPLDAHGNKAPSTEDVSAEKTCGSCHDASYIVGHSSHAHSKATCIQCHLEGGRLEVTKAMLGEDGRLLREALRIGTPRTSNCASCHGVADDGNDAVLLPPALAQGAPKPLALTQGEGAIVSPQKMSESFLNLEGKSSLTVPWDVHAAKLVDCASCHYAENDPARSDNKGARLPYVTVDPRRTSIAQFLVRPDHRLAKASCRSCHEVSSSHGFLPYRARHLEVVACATCHIPAPMGPTLEMVDSTVVTRTGEPSLTYRNLDRRDGEGLNAAMLRPFVPLVAPRTEEDGKKRLAPINIVSRYRWVDGEGKAEVPASKVSAAYLENGQYASPVLAALDTNHDGSLDPGELRLDTDAKVQAIQSRLKGLGIANPRIDGTMRVYPLAHGVLPRSRALRECSACHAADSRLAASFPLTPYTPGGISPTPPSAGTSLLGSISVDPRGGLSMERTAASARLYVLGKSRHALTNTMGFFLFLSVFLGVSAHGLARIVLRRRAGKAVAVASKLAPRTELVFGRYERLWHWTMALSGLVLIVTGLDIHAGGTALVQVVAIHNGAAVVLTVNAFLSLFYHLTTVAIRNFIPRPEGLWKRILEHVQYQSRGIFYGAHHPEDRGEKLNPLQQLTYLALLNVLFPVQIVTGILLWAVGKWPEVALRVGGLALVAPVHNLGAWLFLTFFVLHLYLVTTGRTVEDHLLAMVTGYRHVDAHEDSPAASSPSQSS